MARREIQYRVPHEGRDRGKIFIIREMSSFDAEMWAYRALSIVARSGADILQVLKSNDERLSDDEAIRRAGTAGLFVAGIQTLFTGNFVEAKPLLDEMMLCVRFLPDLSHAEVTRTLVEDDIEEVETLMRLRWEVYNLHTGFSKAVAPSTSTRSATAAKTESPIMPPVRMSRRRS